MSDNEYLSLPNPRPRLIALCSPVMGSGKSVVATELVENHGFMLVKFACTLKRMIRRLLADLGTPDEMIDEMIEGHRKEQPIEGFYATLRMHWMPTLLSNMVREMLADIGLPEDYYGAGFDVPIGGLDVTPRLLFYALNHWMLNDLLFRETVTPRWLLQSLGTEWGRECIREDLWTTIVEVKVKNAACDIVIDDMRFINEHDTVLCLGGKAIRIERPGIERTTPPHPSEGALDRLNMWNVVNDGTIDELREKAVALI